MNIYGKTDIGIVRDTNQDTFAFGQLVDNGYYLLVCDGMGGANGGHIASQLARDIIAAKITQNVRSDMDQNSIRNLIVTAITAANSMIYNKACSDEELDGMGTTVVLAIVMGDTIYLGHVGDSRAYLAQTNGLIKLTRDHSVIELLLEQGKITKEQAQVHPQKNQITRAVGVETKVQIDYSEFEFLSGNRLLICTDGLTNTCTEDHICEIVQNNHAKQACSKLLNSANRAGGQDNITAVILEN